MTEDKIFEKIKEITANQLGIDDATIIPEATFSEQLGADSLDVVELVMAFEDAFEIDIEDDDAGQIATVQDAIDFIKRGLA
ncbi:acyl carrier protein [Gloeomargaritaceae cyanobacterium AH-226-B11]|jgi:acyl carrier protein|nr:acyl carrier protein [Gloeomargaritaceae cyanobacterium AH-226-B11]